jgi:O-antigen ligase
MRTNTDFSIPDFFARNSTALFWSISFSFLLVFAAAVYTGMPYLFIVPFAFLFIAITFLNFRTVFFLLIALMPVSTEFYLGTYGTDLPSEPIVMLLAVCTVLYLIRWKDELNSSAFRHPILLIVMLQLIWSMVATFYSTDVWLSVKYLLAKSWYILGFLILPVLLFSNEKTVRIFFWCLFLPTAGSVVYVLIRHAGDGFTFDSVQHAVSPIYRNHVNYAVFITMVLPFIVLAKNWYPSGSFKHKTVKFAVPVFLAAIYFSYTRGAWLAVVAMLIYYFVLRWNLTKWLLAVAAIAVLGFSVYVTANNNYLKYAPNYDNTIYHEELAEHLSSTFEMEDMSTVERFYRWIAAVKLSKQHPFVGVGPNNFVSNYKPYTVTAYETYISDNEERSTVHNYFLLLLTEQGIPAVLLYLLLIIVVLTSAQRMYTAGSDSGKQYIAAVTLCLVVFLLNNTLSDLVEANKVGSLFFICLALLISNPYARQESDAHAQ